FDRVGNETILVGGMVHLVELIRAGRAISTPANLRAKLDTRDGELALGVFLHVANRLVFVRIEHELLLARDRQERDHVTARERSDHRFRGMRVRRITEISRGRRRRHRMAAVEYPSMIARIFLIRKFGAAALPFQSHSVFGHVVYMECARTRRNRRTQAPQRGRLPARGASYVPLACKRAPHRAASIYFRAPPPSPVRRPNRARTPRADRRRAACGPGHRRANSAAWPPARRATHPTAAIRSARG